MTQKITHLFGSDGPMLMVRGEDPAEIHRLATEWVAEEDPGWMEVTDSPEDISVVSIRAVPGCGWPCDCGNRTTHYLRGRGGRGSFRGAFVNIHTITTDEMEQRRAVAGV
ncbi:hypothetical protein [Microbispora triticiradicis]|uniref:hypothetical protein n=1 Tax=Microbispora triticiradicis TaxID=2200763 RepID=UPI001AD7893F|nr:hypothetical protein [Microbispora triticiradicis]MBO4273108.1 hypothetical protein [Microbispora triticiradicis]